MTPRSLVGALAIVLFALSACNASTPEVDQADDPPVPTDEIVADIAADGSVSISQTELG